MEDLTFLAEDETGDGIPLGVHTVSIMSLVSCGDSEVGDVMRHMQAATSGAWAIKPHLKRLNDRRGAANSTLRPPEDTVSCGLRTRDHPISDAGVSQEAVLNTETMRVWWCNQSKCWDVESSKKLVIASGKTKRPTFRATVGEVMAGDITLHCERGWIRAVSLATTDGRYSDTLPNIGPESYGFGWSFKAEYTNLEPWIRVDDVRQPIVELLKTQPRENGFAFQGPSQKQPGKLLQGYFLRFSLAGLQVVKNASDVEWPEWVP